MKKLATLGEILEAADKLSMEEKGTIIDILNRRLIDERRKEIINEVHEAQKEYKEGRYRQGTSEKIIKGMSL